MTPVQSVALALIVVAPLCLALTAVLGWLGARQQVGLGLALILGSLATLASAPLQGQALQLALGNWPPPLGIAWQLDLPTLMMLGMTACVAAAASLALLADRASADDRYLWPLWWLLWAGLNALLLSQDLFNLYVTLELVTLAGVGLVARSPGDPYGAAALRYLLASLLASLLFLLGVALLYGQTGRLDIALLSQAVQDDSTLRLAATLMTLGLLIKSAMVPLHTWLPAAHARAQAPVSAMLSAVVVAVTLFLTWRLWLGPFAILHSLQTHWLGLTGAVALAWGGIQAALQTRLKLLIAWSTLSQSGYALLMLSLPGPTRSTPTLAPQGLAFDGALQVLLAHGLAKGALFLAAGAIIAAHGHDRMSRLAGSAQHLPMAWLAMALAGASLLGIPPTGGFVGKWWLLQASLESGSVAISAAVLLGTFFTAACLWRLFDIGLCPLPRRPATQATPAGANRTSRHLAVLALGLAALAWVWGLVLLGRGQAGLHGLRLDSIGLAFLAPALVVWPLVILATRYWRATFPAANRLLGLLLLGAAVHVMALLADDLLTFYTGAALLSLLGWAMVQHDGHRAARLAGAGYLGMMLLAEVAMLLGLALIANESRDLRFSQLGSEALSPLALTSLGLGLAIKAGVLGVHAWLPVAHPVAPPMASAILSGLMIKLGLLGALRLLPLGEATPGWGAPLVVLGFAAAFYGALRGVFHTHTKAILAWSSVSQMGLLTALLGLVLQARATQAAMAALLLLAATHALAKAALFLGAGMANRLQGRDRRRALWGLVLPAAALAGVPPGGGALVKAAMESAFHASGWPAWPLFGAGLATTLLMLRLFWRLHRTSPEQQTLAVPAWLWIAWWLLGALPVLLAWAWHWQMPLTETPGYALASAAIAPLLALGVLLLARMGQRFRPSLKLRRLQLRLGAKGERTLIRLAWRLKRGEAWLMPWPAFGIALGVMALGMAAGALLG